MPTPATSSEPDQQAYERARRKVQQIKGLYVHVSIYCIVIAGLFLINFFSSRGTWWFFWPALGWGVGLAFHAFGVYGTEALFGADWEERKLREILERERRAPGERR